MHAKLLVVGKHYDILIRDKVIEAVFERLENRDFGSNRNKYRMRNVCTGDVYILKGGWTILGEHLTQHDRQTGALTFERNQELSLGNEFRLAVWRKLESFARLVDSGEFSTLEDAISEFSACFSRS